MLCRRIFTAPLSTASCCKNTTSIKMKQNDTHKRIFQKSVPIAWLFFYVQGYFFNPLQKQPRVLYEALWLLMFQYSWTKTNFLPLQYLEYLGSILKNKATDLALISKTDLWTLWKKVRVGCFKRTASKHVHYLGWNWSSSPGWMHETSARTWCTGKA